MCSVDTSLFRPIAIAPEWDLSYLGTYSPDRQTALERLLIEPARLMPDRNFVVAGAQYPKGIKWPANVHRIEHVQPDRIPAFFAKSRWTLNLTRAEMIGSGFSPSVRLFEAAACGVPIISDRWRGLETIFDVGIEIVLADATAETIAALHIPEQRRREIAKAARSRILASHSATHRAAELESLLTEAMRFRFELAGASIRSGTKARQ